MSYLYKSASGNQVQHASHSALSSFRFCRRKFRLNRVDGWRQKDRKASLEIGKCFESAIQFFHENGCKPGDCVDEWKRLWIKFSNIELVYTDQEQDFQQMYTIGAEWAKLYEVRLPNLPIRNPKFQLAYRKKVFPGTTLDDLEFLAYVDMLSTLEDGRRVVIDIKTAKSGLDLTPNMVAMDPQLREYAWMSGIQDVAFLWFVKAKPESFKHGDTVALLENSSNWKAGDELVVFKYQESDTGEKSVILGSYADVETLDKALDEIKGKGSTDAKNEVVSDYLFHGTLQVVPRAAVTKTKLQWVQGKIPLDVLPEVGQRIGHDMIQLKTASEDNFFPQDGGVRFPNQSCTWCEQRGHCLGDRKMVEQMLVQIKTPDEPDWLAELEEEAA